MIFLQPATIAGINCISNDDTSGADPPGTYIPTLSIGLNSFHILIPLVVSIVLKLALFKSDLQTVLILFAACKIAILMLSVNKPSDFLISFIDTLSVLGVFNPSSSLICLNALVPFCRIIFLYLKIEF